MLGGASFMTRSPLRDADAAQQRCYRDVTPAKDGNAWRAANPVALGKTVRLVAPVTFKAPSVRVAPIERPNWSQWQDVETGERATSETSDPPATRGTGNVSWLGSPQSKPHSSKASKLAPSGLQTGIQILDL
jgi:hypothetical protein